MSKLSVVLGGRRGVVGFAAGAVASTAGDSRVYYGTMTALEMGTVSPSGFTTVRGPAEVRGSSSGSRKVQSPTAPRKG